MSLGCYVALMITIPAASWRLYGSPDTVRTSLEAHGLLPASAEEVRWHIDPLSQGLVLQARVPLVLEKEVGP